MHFSLGAKSNFGEGAVFIRKKGAREKIKPLPALHCSPSLDQLLFSVQKGRNAATHVSSFLVWPLKCFLNVGANGTSALPRRLNSDYTCLSPAFCSPLTATAQYHKKGSGAHLSGPAPGAVGLLAKYHFSASTIVINPQKIAVLERFICHGVHSLVPWASAACS